MQIPNLKSIQTLPSAAEFIEIGLNRTQRKTPSIVKNGWPIQRIREFYRRKVKFMQSDCQERIGKILDQFPKIEEIHPFYFDLLNLLYDKKYFKFALGRLNT